MFQFQKRKCTCDAVGKITKVFFNDSGSRRVTVEYVVDGVSYTIRENITVKNEAIKMEGIPVGQKKTEYITAGIDESVAVKYNPENPKKAYLKDNAGKSV